MKIISVGPRDRIELLRYVNILRELNCNTLERLPIYYEHLCELETFMYKLSKILEFEQHNRGCRYTDYQLKEDLPKETKDETIS
jgi:hypothetical protein